MGKFLTLMFRNSQWLIGHGNKNFWDGYREGRYREREYVVADLEDIDPAEHTSEEVIDIIRTHIEHRGGVHKP